MTEAQRHGMLRQGESLPEDFDLTSEIDTYRFLLMCKFKFPNVESFTKKHDIYLKDLQDRIIESTHSEKLVKKLIEKISLAAYYSISEGFFPSDKKIPKK